MTAPKKTHAELVAEARRQAFTEALARSANAATLTDALAELIATYEFTQLPHLPIGGGYASPRRARALAEFLSATLTETGWTT